MPKRIDAVGLAHYEPHLDPGGRRRLNTMQDFTEFMLRRMLMEIAMNRFEWTGFPDEVDVRWLEMSLLEHGLSVFFHDDEYNSYFAMKGSGAGNLNMVGNYTKFQVYGNQFFVKELDADDCVPIWSNYNRFPDIDIIDIYAHKIADMDRSVEINAHNARRGKVATVNEKTKLAIDNIIEAIDRGDPVIKMVPGVTLNEIFDSIDLGVDPDMILNLDMLRDRQWQKANNLLGINGSNQDKKERLVAAEASANDEMVEVIRRVNLNARQVAADQINKKYGLNVEVDYSTDMENDANMDPEIVGASQGGRQAAGDNA